MSRKAMEMALEWMRDEGIEWIGKGDEVKKALRAALAESAKAESNQSDEVERLREANEAFAKRQAWWTERMFELEQERDKLAAALAEATAPVALESVELQRDTSGMCTVLVNGRVAIRDNGDVISHHATLDWFACDRAARAAMEMLRQECDDSDALLRLMGLDPEQYRTEGGSLNLPKIRTALAEAEKAEAQADAEPVAWPASMRREVERQIAAMESPSGMQLNDAKERPVLPAGTLRRMLAIIDSCPPRRELSDQEIHRIWLDTSTLPDFVRAVLRAAGGKCQARQHSDQMHCESCGLTWDMNDPHPPKCAAGGEG